MDQKQICVILPCLNEEQAIVRVVEDFLLQLPNCTVRVFDNNSSDNTAEVARKAGATVHTVKKKGKGHVIQAMFREVEADIYVLADGDGTYPATEASAMINKLINYKADLVIGSRLQNYAASQSRPSHLFGNKVLTRVVSKLFGTDAYDLLSGYRVMSRRYVKTMPIFSKGFEVETAMTVHAIEVGAKIVEHPICYLPRAAGTSSKLNTWRDGYKIGKEILQLYKDHSPKTVYFLTALLFLATGLLVGVPVIIEFIETGLVPKFPRAFLASALVTIGFFSAFTGIILNAISKARKETKRLAFLTLN